jgi:NADH dehydrogenase FAD-containing subunit
MRRILILGGGFGGVYTAVHLEKLMTPAERESTEITIVSRDNATVRALTAVAVVVVNRPAFQERRTNLPSLRASIENITSVRTGRRVDLCGDVARAMDDKIKGTQL